MKYLCLNYFEDKINSIKHRLLIDSLVPVHYANIFPRPIIFTTGLRYDIVTVDSGSNMLLFPTAIVK